MPAKFEEYILVKSQVDESLLPVGACIKPIRLGNDSERAFTFFVDCPNLGDNALIGIIVGRGNTDPISMLLYALMFGPFGFRSISTNFWNSNFSSCHKFIDIDHDLRTIISRRSKGNKGSERSKASILTQLGR